MKKNTLTVAVAAALCGSMCLTSCLGSFTLTNKLLSWNKAISNKFVNELVFIAFWVLPVYEVSGLADILVLNSIEFWSGENPVACGTTKIQGSDGQMYLIECDGKGYNVRNMADNTTIRLDFDCESREWSIENDGRKTVFMTFVDDTHVKMPVAGGGEIMVETTQNGVYAYRALAGASDMATR